MLVCILTQTCVCVCVCCLVYLCGWIRAVPGVPAFLCTLLCLLSVHFDLFASSSLLGSSFSVRNSSLFLSSGVGCRMIRYNMCNNTIYVILVPGRWPGYVSMPGTQILPLLLCGPTPALVTHRKSAALCTCLCLCRSACGHHMKPSRSSAHGSTKNIWPAMKRY